MKLLLQLTILFFMIGGCSTVSDTKSDRSYLENLDRKYPYFNIQLDEFITETELASISVAEKRNMLKAMSFLRFVINTPEFARELLTNETPANGGGRLYKLLIARTLNGSQRNIVAGQHYDNEIILKLLQHANITMHFRKLSFNGGDTTATANLGKAHYIDLDLRNPVITDSRCYGRFHRPTTAPLLIGFASSDRWTGAFYRYDDPIFLKLLLHELAHSLGITHTSGSNGAGYHHEDTAVQLGDIVRSTISDYRDETGANIWRKKYKAEYEKYDYYEVKYEHFLQEDTVKK